MTLHGWQLKYIQGLREGRPEAEVLKEIRISDAKLAEELAKGGEFASAVATARGAEETKGVLCVAEVFKLREAQVSENRTAGYFGLTVAEFREKLKADPELMKAFETAPLSGQAKIQAAQFDQAVNGDTDMLKWLGKNHLEQADKIETRVEVVEITDPKELAKRMAFLNAQVGMVIEGVAVPVDDTETAPNPENTLLLQSP